MKPINLLLAFVFAFSFFKAQKDFSIQYIKSTATFSLSEVFKKEEMILSKYSSARLQVDLDSTNTVVKFRVGSHSYAGDGLKVWQDGTLKNGKLIGLYNEFDSDGNLKRSLRFSNSGTPIFISFKKESYSNTFSYSGSSKNSTTGLGANGFYSDTIFYYPKNYSFSQSNKTYFEVYKNGKLDGKCTSIGYSNNVTTCSYKNGVKDGLCEMYSSDGGLLEQVNYIDGLKQGLEKKYNSRGKLIEEGNYVNDKLDGDYKRFSKNGLLIGSSTYKNGNQIGKFVRYNSDGEIKERGEYNNEGKLIGMYIKFSEDSVVAKELNYKNGKKHGQAKEFYQNGKLKELVTYEEDEMHGVFLDYYKDGKKRTEGAYYFGTQIGVWKEYDLDGKVYRWTDYGKHPGVNDVAYSKKDKYKSKYGNYENTQYGEEIIDGPSDVSIVEEVSYRDKENLEKSKNYFENLRVSANNLRFSDYNKEYKKGVKKIKKILKKYGEVQLEVKYGESSYSSSKRVTILNRDKFGEDFYVLNSFFNSCLTGSKIGLNEVTSTECVYTISVKVK